MEGDESTIQALCRVHFMVRSMVFQVVVAVLGCILKYKCCHASAVNILCEQSVCYKLILSVSTRSSQL
jgi:hypothetical protein